MLGFSDKTRTDIFILTSARSSRISLIFVFIKKIRITSFERRKLSKLWPQNELIHKTLNEGIFSFSSDVLKRLAFHAVFRHHHED